MGPAFIILGGIALAISLLLFISFKLATSKQEYWDKVTEELSKKGSEISEELAYELSLKVVKGTAVSSLISALVILLGIALL